eukprot:TRINITY_DN18411_c0_g1_i1.p1 TRINITY_DN18411_c0_g1~~TRINITY_DN18411_c0_g1_i1.p1  ORF type:complete len:350 (+),score=9.36 TRINITY_DN18411_c0_g1_i1:178-1227(+)
MFSFALVYWLSSIASSIPPPASSGHWRCWQEMLRLGTFFEDGADINRMHFNIRVQTQRSGVPLSDVCCAEQFGPTGNSLCWHGSYSYEHCCGLPELPHRCVGTLSHSLKLRNHRVVGSVWRNLTATELVNCATLDELATYLSDLVIGASDKFSEVHDYLNVYEPLLAPLGFSASLLEIGVAKGHSLAMWSLWFPSGNIVGVDIQLRLEWDFWGLSHRGANVTGNTRTIEADAESATLLDALGSQTFDVIIDDGSHTREGQISSFELLFPTKLRAGGYYFVEDVNLIDQLRSSFDFFAGVARMAWVDGTRTFTAAKRLKELRLQNSEDWRYQIDSVTFRRELVIIRKAAV